MPVAHDSILVLAAHPDDEVIGCGGTIAKLVDAGARIHVAFLADGVSSRKFDHPSLDSELLARRAAAEKACEILGVQSVSFGDFPDNRMDTVPMLEIAQAVEALIYTYQPATVFTHHAGDINVDHRRLHEATVVACRPQQGCPVKTFLCYEVASSTEWQLPGCGPVFSPNWFVDISTTHQRKLLALEAYALELRVWPHPRSLQGIEYLMRWRGATVGVNFAEAFILGRRLS
jgi:LmbE family N-acetylglucosaminyl deacetylase